MSYVEKTMARDEKILRKAQIHWADSLPEFFLMASAIILGIVSAVGVLANGWLVAAVIAFVFGLIIWAGRVIDNYGVEIAVTNRRVVIKRGLISRKTEEQRLAKIDSITVDQSPLGRILGYGTIGFRGSGVSMTPLKTIADPLSFRAVAQQALETHVDEGGSKR